VLGVGCWVLGVGFSGRCVFVEGSELRVLRYGTLFA